MGTLIRFRRIDPHVDASEIRKNTGLELGESSSSSMGYPGFSYISQIGADVFFSIEKVPGTLCHFKNMQPCNV